MRCDKNEDGVFDGNDWLRMSRSDKDYFVGWFLLLYYRSRGSDLTAPDVIQNLKVIKAISLEQLDLIYSNRAHRSKPIGQVLKAACDYGWKD